MTMKSHVSGVATHSLQFWRPQADPQHPLNAATFISENDRLQLHSVEDDYFNVHSPVYRALILIDSIVCY